MKTQKQSHNSNKSAMNRNAKAVLSFRRSQLIGAAVIASSGMIALAATVPNTFSSGSPALAADVNANFQALAAALSTAESKIAALENKLASVSIENINGYTTVRFTGVNVQVVNGANSTATANGTGNLIVGYDETYAGNRAYCTLGTNPSTGTIVTHPTNCSAAGGTWVYVNTGGFKTGSHYLVLGSQNNYSRWGGLVAGVQNTSNYDYASVIGGVLNNAGGRYASVIGGATNTASGLYASVTGGSSNTASGDGASISAGSNNTASGGAAGVSGGSNNFVSGGSASVSGGANNTASGSLSSVSGGWGCNVATNLGWDVGNVAITGCSPNVTQ